MNSFASAIGRGFAGGIGHFSHQNTHHFGVAASRLLEISTPPHHPLSFTSDGINHGHSSALRVNLLAGSFVAISTVVAGHRSRDHDVARCMPPRKKPPPTKKKHHKKNAAAKKTSLYNAGAKGGMKRNGGGVVLIDANNPSDEAFDMAYNYGKCTKSTLRVAANKMAARVQARKSSTSNDQQSAVTVEDLDDIVEEEEDDADDDDTFTVEYKNSKCNVSIGNYDLAHIVNGYPGDSIELRPFDYVFQPDNIKKWWEKVGYLPMARNTLNDDKVRWEVGPGGTAPTEAAVRLELLMKDYKEAAQRITQMGFNETVLDLEPAAVEEAEIPPEGFEAKVQAVMANKTIAKAGGLFKVGVHLANGDVLIEANNRFEAQKKEAKVAKVQKKKSEAETKERIAILAYNKWVFAGRLVHDNGNPELGKDASVAIVKVLMPNIAPELKLSEYKNMKVCEVWLGSLARGTTWNAEMEAVTKEYGSGFIQRQGSSLFQLPK